MDIKEATKKIMDSISTINGIVPKDLEREWGLIVQTIKRDNVNLCHICCNIYPNCPGMEKPVTIRYGKMYNDNIYECSEFVSEVDFEENSNN